MPSTGNRSVVAGSWVLTPGLCARRRGLSTRALTQNAHAPLDRARSRAVSVRAMSTDPIAFFLDTLPELFTRGVVALAASPEAQSRLADVRAARGGVQLVLEGEGGGEVYLAVDGGVMKGQRARPELPVRFCIAVPVEALRGGLELLEESGSLTHADAPLRVAGLASGKTEKLVDKEKLAFHVILKNVPELDSVTIRIGIGVDGPPEKPGFTVTVDYDDLEEVRAGQLTPQQLFMSKLKIVGDASRALALAMTLMQQQRPRR